MPTIKDVAKESGYSLSTVSRVINNHPYVTEEKRQKVYAAMKKLGYVPNSVAQKLRKNKVETIAIIISRIINPFFSMLVDEMEKAAYEHGYQLILCNTRQDKEREIKYLNLLKTKQIDGIILASMENEWKTIEPYMAYGPIVLCNEYRDDASAPMVKLDQIDACYKATKHLIELGHKKIAFCGGNDEIPLSLDRKKGFLEAIKEADINLPHYWFFEHAYGIDDGKRIVKEIHDLQDKPTAIFTCADEVAAGFIRQAKILGYRIPEDFAVVGFDDQPLADLISPGLTTVYQPIRIMVEKTMEIMLDMTEKGIDCEGRVELIPNRLIIRGSTSNKKLALPED
ncbi:LacI family DNA-binding transcriptional regulator [Alteribacillus sp. HJP-4]|uniref:LacI family DNA-binding transcriptional regulator n=1 Tax=Alteribacillus sp. HJP-4 TaxID=2775394 RepID=UPI0035CCE38B